MKTVMGILAGCAISSWGPSSRAWASAVSSNLGQIGLGIPLQSAQVVSNQTSFQVISYLGISAEYTYSFSRAWELQAQYELNNATYGPLFQGPSFYLRYVAWGGKTRREQEGGVSMVSTFPFSVALYMGFVQRTFSVANYNPSFVTLFQTGDYVTSGACAGVAGGVALEKSVEKLVYGLRLQQALTTVQNIPTQAIQITSAYLSLGYVL